MLYSGPACVPLCSHFVGDLHLNLIQGCLGPHKSASKRHLDRFIHFCTAHPCATCVGKDSIYTHCVRGEGRCSPIIRWTKAAVEKDVLPSRINAKARTILSGLRENNAVSVATTVMMIDASNKTSICCQLISLKQRPRMPSVLITF